jgi:hypothetical protein
VLWTVTILPVACSACTSLVSKCFTAVWDPVIGMTLNVSTGFGLCLCIHLVSPDTLW